MASVRKRCGPVLVVDDDATVVALLEETFARAGYAVTAAASGEEALAAALREQPCAAVVDVCLPGLSGYGLCHALRSEFGEAVPVVFVSGERTESYDRVGGLLLGAADYLVKPFDPNELVLRLTGLLRRQLPLGRHDGTLTPREREVLALLADGLGSRAIAERLVISEKTVATHIERILFKLDAHSRAEAVAIAYRADLVSLPA